MKLRTILLFLVYLLSLSIYAQKDKVVRIGLAGLSHSHVDGVLRNLSRNDIQIVGIAEKDTNLAKRYAEYYGFDLKIVYSSLEEMIEKTKPEGVLAFNSIFDHLHVVEVCAPKGIHVMVEKPLAVSTEHAEKMQALAKKYNILLLTNYETTWYPSNHKAYAMAVEDQDLGNIRKIIVCDGHKGPKEIGINKEFLNWLTDSVLNGGGAVVDFGCYGANLATWLMQNQPPISVTSVLQHIKPDVYPNVDDEATIILTYPKAQVIIQASWNWPFDRKDMEIYGVNGYIKAPNAIEIEFKTIRESSLIKGEIPALNKPYDEPFRYFSAAIRGKIKVNEYDLSSLENNMIVVKILEAAKKSAQTKKTVSIE